MTAPPPKRRLLVSLQASEVPTHEDERLRHPNQRGLKTCQCTTFCPLRSGPSFRGSIKVIRFSSARVGICLHGFLSPVQPVSAASESLLHSTEPEAGEGRKPKGLSVVCMMSMNLDTQATSRRAEAFIIIILIITIILVILILILT